jgi:HAMP domain.
MGLPGNDCRQYVYRVASGTQGVETGGQGGEECAQITAENLSERLPVPPANDEIGRLVETLNSMIARLQQSFEQVRQFTSDASH